VRAFASKTELVNANGDHVRYLPGELGRAVPFSVKEHLDCGAVVWKHRQRATGYE
jgi:hypothetical protein